MNFSKTAGTKLVRVRSISLLLALWVVLTPQADALRLVEPPYSPSPVHYGGVSGLLVGSPGAGERPELLAFNKGATELAGLRLQPNAVDPKYTLNHSPGISAILEGKPGLVTISSSGLIYFRPASEAGGFAQEVLIESHGPGNPRSVRAADVNRDGIPDLVISQEGSLEVGVIFGSDREAFEPLRETSRFRVLPTQFWLADFNGDGNVDLVAINQQDDTVDLYLGDGRGRFMLDATIPLPQGSSPVAVAVADFNGDSRLDFAVANMNRNNVTVFLREGDGFRALPEIPVGTHPMALTAGDLDGDGRLDLVVANHTSQNLSVLLGLGGGQFTLHSLLPAHDYVTDVQLGDFDGNGRIDIASAGSNLSVYLNDPSEIFERVGNGSFEGPGLARWQSSGQAFRASGFGSAIMGHGAAVLHKGTRIWQVLETNPARNYVLTFHYRGLPADLEVTLNGAAVPLAAQGNWTRWEFTADADQTVLTFEGLAPSSAVTLDQVSVVPIENERPISSTVEFLATKWTPGLQSISLVRTGNLDEPAYVTIEYNGGEHALEGFRAGGLEVFRNLSNWNFIIPSGPLGFAQGARRAVVVFAAGQQFLSLYSDFDRGKPPASTDVARLTLIGSHNCEVGPKAAMVLSRYPELTPAPVPEGSSVRENLRTLIVRLPLSYDNARVPHGAIRVFTTESGTATPGVDFQPIDVTVPPGEATELVFSIPIVDDQIPEGDETIEVQFEGLLGGTQKQVYTILDNDLSRFLVNPQPHSPINGSFASESSGQITFRLVRQAALNSEISFRVQTRDLTAIAGEDYEAIDQRVTFAAGQTEHLVTVPLIDDDVAIGAREKIFLLEFSEPSAPAVLPNEVWGSIHDDDPLLYIELLAPSGTYDISFSEGDSAASIVLRLNRPYSKPILLGYQFVESKYATPAARAGIDFEPVAGEVHFLPGETDKRIAVPIMNNSRMDGPRAFDIAFSEARYFSLNRPGEPIHFPISIIDDETPVLKQKFPIATFGPHAQLLQDHLLWVINNGSLYQLSNDAFPNPSFGARGRIPIPSLISGYPEIVPDGFGGLLLCEWNDNIQTITRLRPGGALDPEVECSFPSEFLSTSIIRQMDGKLIVAASGQSSSGLRRYFPNGALDQSFPFHDQPGHPKQIDPHGHIYLVLDGRAPDAIGVLARLAPDGSVDSSFTLSPATYGTFEFEPDGTRNEWVTWGEHYGLLRFGLDGHQSSLVLGRIPGGLPLVNSFSLPEGHRFLNLNEYCSMWGCQYVQKLIRPDGVVLDLGTTSAVFGPRPRFFPSPAGFWTVDWQAAHHFSVSEQPVVGPESTESLQLASDRGLRLIRSGQTSAPASVQCAWRNLSVPSAPLLQTAHFAPNEAEIWVKPPGWNHTPNATVSAFDLGLVSAQGAALSNLRRSRVVIVNEQSLEPRQLHIQRLSDQNPDDLLLIVAGPDDQPYMVSGSPTIPWNTDETRGFDPYPNGRRVFIQRSLDTHEPARFYRLE